MQSNDTHNLLGLSISEWNSLIDEWTFSQRDRMIMKRRIIDGLTYDKLAEEFDMSVRQLKKIVKREQQNIASVILDKKMHK